MEPMDENTSPPGASGGPSGRAPVPIPPTPSSGLSGSATAAQNASGLSKRRRGLGIVTPNACTECRKKRAKCDGQKPCSRCRAQQGVDCVYEMPVRQSKDNLRRELEHLKRQQRNSDSVFAALVRPELWEEVMTRLRNGYTVDKISEWLGGTFPSGEGALPVPGVPGRGAGPSSGFPAVATFASSGTTTYGPRSSGMDTVSPISSQHHHQGIRHEADQASPWSGPFSSRSRTVSTRSSSHADGMSWGTETLRGGRQSKVGNWLEDQGPSDDQGSIEMEKLLAPEMPEMKVPAGAWTNITSDLNLVQHLLSLYFCWEYPTFASLSKEHFLRDFQEGRARFCSSILVNALLALGCRFSSQPNTRSNPDDPYTSGDHFFKECQSLFCQEEDHHKLTTIQALGIMSIREASCGRDSESWYYAGQSIRLAMEMGLHQVGDDGGDEDEVAVQAATFWGAFALDHAWSLATGSLPQTSCFPSHPPKPAIIDDIEASLWIPYTDDGLPLQKSCEQPSNVRSVYKCFCELSELVHQSLYILHSPGRPLTSRDLLKIYTQYLNWYDKIPEVLRLGHNFTPAVLFAHMYYHFAILLLFRPLIKLRIIGSSISPRDVCSQAANAIQGLLRSYSQLYTLRRTPSFVPYFVLTSSIMHLAIGASAAATTGSSEPAEDGASLASKLDPHVAESISRGIADLTEMAPCHHFAEQALNILRYLANKWKIDVDIKDEPKEVAGSELLRRAPGSTRPVTSSLNFFAPNFSEQDFVCTLGGSGSGAMGSAGLPAEMQPPNAPPTSKDPMPHMRGGLENPLFWPFPMQGRPMIPSGPLLAEAGFELL